MSQIHALTRIKYAQMINQFIIDEITKINKWDQIECVVWLGRADLVRAHSAAAVSLLSWSPTRDADAGSCMHSCARPS